MIDELLSIGLIKWFIVVPLVIFSSGVALNAFFTAIYAIMQEREFRKKSKYDA